MFRLLKNLGLNQSSEDTPKARKSQGYFLELAEDDANSSSNQKSSSAAKVESEPAKPAPATTTSAEPAKPAAAKTSTTKKTSTPAAPTAAKSEPPAPPAPAKPAPPAPPQTPAIKTFAPDFLIRPSSKNDRRRPGPNMNPFLDMARQVQKPTTKS